jgi:hypothetical protein
MRPESPQIARPDVWMPRLALPYESAYSLLEKYMWLNCASGHDVSRNLFGMHNLPPAREKTHDLLFGKWIQFKKCNFPQGMPLREGLLGSHKSQWPQFLANGSHFRFCASCLALGFHSFNYQFDGISHCPVHIEPLTSVCQQCGAPTGPITLRSAFSHQPFPCAACGKSLIDDVDPQEWFVCASFRDDLAQSLGPIDRWMSELDTQYFKIPEVFPALGKIHLLDKSLKDSDHAIMAHVASKLIPMPIQKECLHEMRRPLSFQIVNVRARPQLSATEHRTERGFRARFKIVKSIRRYLLRTMRMHSRQLDLAVLGLHPRQSRDGPEVIQAADSCPVVVAFARWIANFNWQRTHTELPFPETDGILGINEMDASETLWAFNALTDFYCCLITAVTFQCYLLSREDGLPVARAIFEQIVAETAMPRINWGCSAIERSRGDGGLTAFLLVRADERCFDYASRAIKQASARKLNSSKKEGSQLPGSLGIGRMRWTKFDDASKLKVLREAAETSVSAAAKMFGVSPATIYDWRYKRKYSLDGMPP